MRGCLGLLLFAGCDLVFTLSPPDAGKIADAPGDNPSPEAGGTPTFIAPGDFDRDGDPNDTDPCPLDQAVETGANDTDDDLDGLANNCDPDVNAGLPDCIVLFDYFNDDRMTTDFPWFQGGWFLNTCNDAEFGFCSPPAAGVFTLVFMASLPAARIEAEVRVFGNRGAAPAVELYAELEPSTSSGRACAFAGNAQGAGFADIRDVMPGNIVNVVGAQPTAQLFVSLLDLELRWTPPGDGMGLERNCRVNDHVQLPTEVTTSVLAPSPGPNIGITARNADVRLHYVLVYGSQCR
jgi:hypothetical protein